MTSIGTKFGHISFQGQVITTNTGSQVEVQTSEAIMSESTKCENYVTVAGRFTATGGGRNKLVAALDNAHIISVSTKLSTVRLQNPQSKTYFSYCGLVLPTVYDVFQDKMGVNALVTKFYYTKYDRSCHLVVYVTMTTFS